MDKAAERIAGFLGSAPVILLFACWMVYHNLPPHFQYVNFISDLAIEIGFLILRAETVQSRRMEAYIKQAKADVKKDLHKSDIIIKELNSQRWQR